MSKMCFLKKLEGKPEEALTCNFHGILEKLMELIAIQIPMMYVEAAFGKVRPPLFQQTGVL